MLKNGLANLVGSLLRTAVGILGTPSIIYLLGLEKYGIWVLASSILSIIGLLEAGIGTTTTYQISKDLKKGNQEIISTIIVLVTILLGVAVIILSAAYAITFIFPTIFSTFTQEELILLSQSVRIGSLFVWCKIAQGVCTGIEQAFGKYSTNNILMSSIYIINTIFIVIAAFISQDPYKMMLAQVLISILGLLSHILYIKFNLINSVKFKNIRHLYFDSQKVLETLRFSRSIWGANIGGAIFSQMDKILVGNILDTKALGVYSGIIGICSQVNLISASFIQPILPRISSLSLVNPSEKKILINIFDLSSKINAYISTSIGFLIILFSKEISQLLFTSEYTTRYNQLLIIGTIIYTLYSAHSFSYYIMIGSGQTKSLMQIVLVSGLISLCLIYIGANSINLTGAVLGNIGYLLVMQMTIKNLNSIQKNILYYFKGISSNYFCFVVTSIFILFNLSLNLPTKLSLAIIAFSLFTRKVMSMKESLVKLNQLEFQYNKQ